LELTENDIDEWIKPYATIIGEKGNIDEKLRKSNPPKYFLRSTLPDNFQEYAIALHSYWINYNIPKNEIKENQNEQLEISEDDYTRINWPEFYEFKNINFDFNEAILASVEWKRPFEKQLNNELYPAEGSMDIKHLQDLVEIVTEFYGNQEIELFFIIYATNNWKKDLRYKGEINGLLELLDGKNIRLTPSLIYPTEKNWVINTDYDLSFTSIGGESKFISELVKRNKNEIFRVAY